MMYPRIIKFNFSFSEVVSLESRFVGRLDKFAEEIYGHYKYYKPIAVANGIKYPLYVRRGIRPLYESIKNDNPKIDDDELNEYLNENVSHWNHYGETTSGAYSDMYEGMLIKIPTQQSADEWLNKYGTL